MLVCFHKFILNDSESFIKINICIYKLKMSNVAKLCSTCSFPKTFLCSIKSVVSRICEGSGSALGLTNVIHLR